MYMKHMDVLTLDEWFGFFRNKILHGSNTSFTQNVTPTTNPTHILLIIPYKICDDHYLNPFY